MIVDCLVPPNLAALGVKRQGDGKAADLATIWATPYPVITNYKLWCNDMGWEPFAGGTRHKQGPYGKPGFLLSGYRDTILEGRVHSPHRYAFALDSAVAKALQAEAAIKADKRFARIGLYPDDGFIHIDLAPQCWIDKYGGAPYWVRKNGVYTSFDWLEDAVVFANS